MKECIHCVVFIVSLEQLLNMVVSNIYIYIYIFFLVNSKAD